MPITLAQHWPADLNSTSDLSDDGYHWQSCLGSTSASSMQQDGNLTIPHGHAVVCQKVVGFTICGGFCRYIAVARPSCARANLQRQPVRQRKRFCNVCAYEACKQHVHLRQGVVQVHTHQYLIETDKHTSAAAAFAVLHPLGTKISVYK